MGQHSSTPLIQIPVRELKAGDVFPGPAGWTAVTDVENLHDQFASLQVQYRDGGRGTREWFDPEHQIEVERRPAE